MSRIPVFFHMDQLSHKPLFEWAFGEKIAHPETTSRAERILDALMSDSARFEVRSPVAFPLQALRKVHDKELLTLIKQAMSLPPDKTFYPSVFPKKDFGEASPHNLQHAGFYCFDSGTPLNATTWAAAAWSAACADQAAQVVAQKKASVSYGLCRPPGHHALRNVFGGYCYFNNAALAAYRLRELGKVAIVDIDFHHGNGTQSIFYEDDRVLTVSIHGDPKDFFPYYTGFASEKGSGYGKGLNINYPLPTGVDGQEYLEVLQKALKNVTAFNPKFLIISAGFDTYAGDPVGSFSLETEDFHAIGELFSHLKLPTVVVQEGGYAAEMLGTNVASFLTAFHKHSVSDK